MSDLLFGLATSIYAVGGFFGLLLSSPLSDHYGRRLTGLINSFAFLVGLLLEMFSNSVAQLCVGRFICGLAAGATMVNSPLMLNEISSIERRGVMGAFNQVVTNLGILVTQLMGVWLAKPRHWRYILLGGCCVAAFNLTVGFFAEDTPKWHVKNHDYHRAMVVLKKMRSPETSELSLQSELDGWRAEVSDTKKASLWKYLSSSKYNRLKMVATIILAAQQLTGIPAVFQYGVLVVLAVLPNFSVEVNCIVSAFNIVFTALAGLLIERTGRKVLLLVLNSSMLVCAVLITVGLVKDIKVLAVVMVFLFVCFFAVGMGPIPFLIAIEVTQLEATTAAQAYGTSINWLVTVGISYAFPVVKARIGGYVFLVFAGFLAISTVLIALLFPETKGKRSYEEVWGKQVVEQEDEGPEDILFPEADDDSDSVRKSKPVSVRTYDI